MSEESIFFKKLNYKGCIEKDGQNIVIDTNQCNGCGLCINVCPFGAIEKVGE